MVLPIASLILKSIALSFSQFIFIYHMLKVDLKFLKFAKFLLFSAIPIIFLFFGYNLILYAITQIIIMILAAKIILNIQYKNVIIPILIGYTFYQLIINIYSTILEQFVMLELILNNPIFHTTLFTLVVPATVILVSYVLNKYLKSYFFIHNLHMLDNKQYTFICTFLIVIISLSSYLSPYYMAISGNNYSYKIGSLLNIFFIISLILLYISLKTLYDKQLIEIKNHALIDCNSDMEELNQELRSQKHDFFNHLQVISGMLQLKKYNECFNYVIGVYNTDPSRPTLRTGLISINALLNSKQLRAKHKNVNLNLDIATELDSSKFHVNDWEITKILGNLIDNAIFEETKVSTKDKYVSVKISEDTEHYSFTVYNKNSFIDHGKRNKIFSSGFSTKGKDGHGMGLFIVKNIIDRYKGKIHLESHLGSGTRFSLFFPKNVDQGTHLNPTNSYPPQGSLNTQAN